jgi:hypothetical protein
MKFDRGYTVQYCIYERNALNTGGDMSKEQKSLFRIATYNVKMLNTLIEQEHPGYSSAIGRNL